MRVGLLKGAPDSLMSVTECLYPTDQPITFALDRERFSARNLTNDDLDAAYNFLIQACRCKSSDHAKQQLMCRLLGADWQERYGRDAKAATGWGIIRLALALLTHSGKKLGVIGAMASEG